jgi:hypothetical protein
MTFRPAFLLFVTLLATSSPASAQLRGGGGQTRSSAVPAWWFSGGAVVVGMGTVNDGASGSTWDFSGDPRWQVRGALEKAIQPTTTLGVGVNFGNVDFNYRPLPGGRVPEARADESAAVTTCRTVGCTGQVDLWSVQGVLRGGGAAEGLYQIIEATGGVIGVRGMRAKVDGSALPVANSVDVNAGIGYGIGFALDTDFHVAFVQDWGIAWHAADGLPEGAGRTYRVRNSRITLRYGLGSHRRR